MFVSIYQWFFSKMAQLLMNIRQFFDNIRRGSIIIFHPIICLVEAILISGLALKSVWFLMDWVDGKTELTSRLITYRILVLVPFALLLYRNYIKDTNSPNIGGEGVDSPLLVEITDFVDAIF
jgi:hypothetical protein